MSASSGYCYTALNNTLLQQCCTPANNVSYADVPWPQFVHQHPNRTTWPGNDTTTPGIAHTCTVNISGSHDFFGCIAAQAAQGYTNNVSSIWCFPAVDTPPGPVAPAHNGASPSLGKVGALFVTALLAASMLAL